MIDISSETWATVKKRCEQRIAEAINRLTDRIDERHSDWARGEIEGLRDILALTEAPKVQPSGDYAKRTDRSGY